MNEDYFGDETIVRPSSGYHGAKAPAAQGYRKVWFEVENMPDKRILLPEGQVVKIGRDPDQDLAIGDKTISRGHLVLIRNSNNVVVEIKGLNGLTLNGLAYKDRNIDIVVPTEFTLGDLHCRICFEEEVDEDATILVNSAMRPRGNPIQPPLGPNLGQSFSTPDHGSAPATGWPGQKGSDSASYGFSSPQGEPIQPRGERQPGAAHKGIDNENHEMRPPHQPEKPPAPFEQYPSESHTPSPYNKGQDYRGPVFDDGIDKSSKKGMFPLLIGIGLCGVLICVGGFFIWNTMFRTYGDRPAEIQPPPKPKSELVISTQQDNTIQQKSRINDLYGNYLDEARQNLQLGNKEDACDYLRLIPSSDPYYAKAKEMAEQIDGCDL